jgi:secondary thiamine-phosphate synthase enzyme
VVVTKKIKLQTNPTANEYHVGIVDITSQIANQVAISSIYSGITTVFVTGSTAGVTTIEFEPGLTVDFQRIWQQIIPDNIPYDHNARWGDGNGYSHIRASILGASLTIPFTDKKLSLGTWQQIILADFDNRPRSREITLQIMGE